MVARLSSCISWDDVLKTLFPYCLECLETYRDLFIYIHGTLGIIFKHDPNSKMDHQMAICPCVWNSVHAVFSFPFGILTWNLPGLFTSKQGPAGWNLSLIWNVGCHLAVFSFPFAILTWNLPGLFTSKQGPAVYNLSLIWNLGCHLAFVKDLWWMWPLKILFPSLAINR